MVEKRVNPQVDGRDEDTDGGVTVMADVAGGRLPEVEVDRIAVNSQPQGPPGVQMVVIRVADAVEEMSWVAEGRTERYTFEPGVRYRVPIYIAQELESLGKIWH